MIDFEKNPSPEVDLLELTLLELKRMFYGISNGSTRDKIVNMTFNQLTTLLYQHTKYPEYDMLREYQVEVILHEISKRAELIAFGIDYYMDDAMELEDMYKVGDNASFKLAQSIDKDGLSLKDIFNFIPGDIEELDL